LKLIEEVIKLKEKEIKKIIKILKKEYKYVYLDKKKRTITFSDIEDWANYNWYDIDIYKSSSFFLRLSLIEIRLVNCISDKFLNIIEKINDKIKGIGVVGNVLKE
jgi:hypothetical protein